jgi:hypothetical protein
MLLWVLDGRFRGSPRMPTDRWTWFAWVATLVLLAACLAPKRYVPPGERFGPRIPQQDKIVHFTVFAAFAFAWVRAGGASRPTFGRVSAVLAAAAVLAVGTELLQGLSVIGRDTDAFDALADLAGAGFGAGLGRRRGARATQSDSLPAVSTEG